MRWLILLACLVLASQAAEPAWAGAERKMEEPLRHFSTVLKNVRGKPINDKEALFEFELNEKKTEFLLKKDTEIDPRAKHMYYGTDFSGFKNTLAIVFGGWEKPMVFFYFPYFLFSSFLFLVLFFSLFFSLFFLTLLFAAEWLCQDRWNCV